MVLVDGKDLPATTQVLLGAREATEAFTAGAAAATRQESPACPGGICPGIGNSFYLPAINALEVRTGGTEVFKNRSLDGGCIQLSGAALSDRNFNSADSMQKLISKTMTELDMTGSYRDKALTVEGTAQAMTGSSSHLTTEFHSTHMDITAVTHVVDFLDNDECSGADNLSQEFLKQFSSLAAIDPKAVENSAQWYPYVQFLEDFGSHVMMQQYIGSRFQQWESSTSSTDGIEWKLEAKACGMVEGTQLGGGWSVSACANFTEEEIAEAMRLSTASRRLILGGTDSTRAELLKEVSKNTLDEFIDSAENGDQPVRFAYKPIWHFLYRAYSPGCQEGDPDSCENLQRAANLQAAYEGWKAVECPHESDGRDRSYQSMEIAGTTSLGINTYACHVSKTGCRADDDCSGGTSCFCYGASCIDRGNILTGTELYRDKVRGTREGNVREGVNDSCSYVFLAGCKCDETWAGGLPDRYLYEQGVSKLLHP
ncbi:MAG: MAC/perforin domain-containing protein [Myxococcales bacterium]|nr:MAC/perforin domain-containing protein [Myxococcales bacterium]MDD9971390.1 MAC/perforin domain-containing protein [Myxococcales bacterium]